jgi:hypothetical protein
VKRLIGRLLATAAVVIAMLNLLPLYGQVTGDAKIDPALRKQLDDGSPAYSVRVDLDFPPEYYHIRKLQAVGTVAGVQGDSVRVLQLTPDEVHQIAQFYWVRKVEPLDTTD